MPSHATATPEGASPDGICVVGGSLDPAELSRAAREHSACYLTGHGAESQVVELFELAREFFSLPLDARMEVAAKGAQESGYHGADRNAQVFAATRSGPELRQLFGENKRPRRPAALADAIERYLDAMYPLALRVLSGIAMSLDLPPRYFDAMFGANAIQNLQIRFYDARPPHNPLPLGAHTDPPPITLIAQDDVGGLESLVQERWVPLRPLPGTLVCQFGAMMARWTDDRYPANVHRVKSTEHVPRFSIVYNLLPDANVMVQRLPTCGGRASSPHADAVDVGTFVREHLRRAVGYAPAAATALRTAESGDDALELAVLERCRAVVRRDSDGAFQLAHARRIGPAIRVDLAAGDASVVLDISRVEPGRRYFKSLRNLGFSYRDRSLPPTILQTLERILPGLADSVAPIFET